MSEQEAKLYEIMGKMLKEARLKAGFTLDTLPYIQWRNDAVRRKAFIYAASAY